MRQLLLAWRSQWVSCVLSVSTFSVKYSTTVSTALLHLFTLPILSTKSLSILLSVCLYLSISLHERHICPQSLFSVSLSQFYLIYPACLSLLCSPSVNHSKALLLSQRMLRQHNAAAHSSSSTPGWVSHLNTCGISKNGCSLTQPFNSRGKEVEIMLVLAYYTILPYYTSVHYTGAVRYGTTQVMFCASLSVHKLFKFGSGGKAKYQYRTTHGLGVGARLSTSIVLHMVWEWGQG